MSHNIEIRTRVDLDNRQVQDIFQSRLHQLIGDHYIQDGWVYRVDDMQGRGSDVHEKIAEVDHPEVELIVAAIRLRELTKDLCPNRLYDSAVYGALPVHRMKDFAPGQRCLDCGRFQEKRS